MSNLLQNTNFEIKSIVLTTTGRTPVTYALDRSVVTQFEYTEGLYNQFLKVTLQIADTTNAISDQLFGMEEIEIVVKDLIHGITYDFKKGSKNGPLYVYQIHSKMIVDTGKVLVLELCRKDAIISMQERYGLPIENAKSDQLASIILKNVLQTEKPIDVERSRNPLTFVPPLSRPYDILVWARTKYFSESQQSTDSKGKYTSAGYLFWETYDKYSYKSVDSLCDQKQKINTYTAGTGVGGLDEYYKVQDLKFPQTLDMIDNFNRGFYSGTAYFFDTVNCEVDIVDYKLEDNYRAWKKLGDMDQLPQLNNKVYTGKPTRTVAVTYNKDLFLESNKDSNYSKIRDYAGIDFVDTVIQSISRMGVFTGQILTGTVMGNMRLSAGSIVEIEFQDPFGGIDKNHSGRYIIFELKHIYNRSRDQLKTQFTLVRDSFGV